jgi:hypothetical protein
MSKQQTAEYRKKYWAEVWYPKNRERHIANNKELNRKRRLQIQALTDKIKLERGCADCGYNADPIALDFDHLANKLFSIARAKAKGLSDARILEEIKKCDVVCSNCHRIRTKSRLVQRT